jgi:2-oxoglutarate ferredoxin oxidoreductase subunit gamma
MQSEVQFAGFGGQGIMLMGQIMAQTAMHQGYDIARWLSAIVPSALRLFGTRNIWLP